MSNERETVRRHLDAVRNGSASQMARDYAVDAVLVRGAQIYRGRQEIEAYFGTVAERMAEGRLVTEIVKEDGDRIVFEWRIRGGPADGISGRDTCVVQDGHIVSHGVELAQGDF